MKILKTGIIGCGRIGSLLEEDPLRQKPCTHAGAFNALPSVRITAGCDINPTRLKKFGKAWNVNSLYADYRQMLRDEQLDIVCVAAWTHLHCEMVIEAARSGVQGIFCEKPVANSVEEARKMLKVCKQRKIPLVINHERRWDYFYQKARQMIMAGKIGELKTITGNALSLPPGKLPVKTHAGGALFHDGTHLVDLLLFFGGDIAWVTGHDIRKHGAKNIEETACAMFQFKNGAMGFIEGGGGRKYFNFELDVQGSEGRIIIGNGGQELYLTRKSKRFSGFQELEKVPFPQPKRLQSSFLGGARDMVRCIRNKSPSASSGMDGLKALEVILTIYKSAKLKGKRLKL